MSDLERGRIDFQDPTQAAFRLASTIAPLRADLSALTKERDVLLADRAALVARVAELEAERDEQLVTQPTGEGAEELAKARRGESLTVNETLPALRAAMEVADRAKERGMAAEAQVEAVASELGRYGLPQEAGVPGLLRHIYNNRDAAIGGYKLACDGWQERASIAEARVAELEAERDRAPWKASYEWMREQRDAEMKSVAALTVALQEIADGKPVTVDGVNYIRPGKDRAIAALAAVSGEAE